MKRALILLTGLGVIATVSVTAGIVGAYYYVAPGLPAADTIREIPLQIPLRIYSRDGRLIEEVGERRRILVSYDELPGFVVEAFVAAEDRRFFDHPGVDYQGILRALVSFIRSGSISQGGSTITQQLARDYFLTREQLFTRKLREAFLAYKIEQEFTKEEIMALFVNKMFFGQRAYGVAAAAQVYFGKPLRDINVAEAATLAGVLPAPSQYNPVRSPANATMRRSYVLGRMNELDFIGDAEYGQAMEHPMLSKLHGTANELSAPYVAEMVRREMLERYGEETYSAGYKVVTTLDSRLQEAANYSLRNGLLEFTRRRGYRGPLARLDIDELTLQQPFAEWDEELRMTLQDYRSPGGLQVALVRALDEARNSAQVVLASGTEEELQWFGISWANPYIDWQTTGDAPESVADVLAPGDIVYVMPITEGGYALAQLPAAQSAVVSVDPVDGAITSLAGGFDFAISKFNRVTQAARQPGSSFKPFVYAAALAQGNTLATIILDAPVVISSAALERLWKPINYSGRFYGERRVREALYRSMNLASVRLLLEKTGIGNAVRYLAPFGFNDAALPRNGSLALGGGVASPLDMAQAYATFANGGYAITPYVIDSISGPTGEILYRAEPALACQHCEAEAPQELDDSLFTSTDDDGEIDYVEVSARRRHMTPDEEQRAYELQMRLEQIAPSAESFRPDATVAPELFESMNLAPRVITPQIAFLIQDAMRSVVRRGTGARAWRELQRTDLSGKTGTSNDRRDAWFAGYNSSIVGVVWVGYDEFTPLGPREEGSRTALPIWIEFMRIALDSMPLAEMPMPQGIVTVKINTRTGCPATFNDPPNETIFEHFRTGNVPECDVATEEPNIFNAANDFEDESEDSGEEEEEDPIF
ncbi:MAG: PBP1A family penicillin-binding protein [Gammaproteobacteria bacterium]|nr:PBP1A family penicillin-binding protein [Gammaproteobacteria bacterium]